MGDYLLFDIVNGAKNGLGYYSREDHNKLKAEESE
jgi:hypothetical protein